MAKKNTVDIITGIAEPIAKNHGLTLWDVVFEKEGASWFLRIYIDRQDGGVTINDCENVSREISDKLDELDPISQSYYLEVSSPGLGRRLKRPHHFEVCLGNQVTVKLIRPIEKQREFIGVLKEVTGETITIETDNGLLSFPISGCSYVKLNDDLDLF